MRAKGPRLTSPHQVRRIKITRTGWAFILLSIGLGGAALNTGNNLLYLVFGMLLSLLIVSGILSNTTLHRLSIDLDMPNRLFALTPFPMQVRIKNHKERIPSFAINASYSATAEGSQEFILKIPATKDAIFVLFHKFERRGLHTLPQLYLHTSFPFGLIRKTLPIPTKKQVLVFPKVRQMETGFISQALASGDYLANEKGTGLNPYGVREYQYGDPAKIIHWKSFAKLGQWMVKEFEQEKRSVIHLHLRTANKDSPLTEQAISMTASLLCALIEANWQVELSINGRYLVSKGLGYIDFYLQALALFDSSSDAFAAMETTETPSSLQAFEILITDLDRGSVGSTTAGFIIDATELKSIAANQPHEMQPVASA